MDSRDSSITPARTARLLATDWDVWSLPMPARLRTISAFTVLYAILVAAGHVLRENPAQLTIIWPAAGLVLIALWLSPVRNWPWILAVQCAAEIAADRVFAESYGVGRAAVFALADMIDAVIAAWIMRRLIEDPLVPTITKSVKFFLAAATGAAAGAFIGAQGSVAAAGGAGYLHEWQLWWAGSWLGSLCTLPVALMWGIRARAPELSDRPTPWKELLLISAVLAASIAWIFSAPAGSLTSLADMPFIILAGLIAASFRLPPRWSITVAAASSLLIAAFASRGLGPYSGDAAVFARIGGVQIYLATLLAVSVMMTIVLRQMRDTIHALGMSEERYRNFIHNSSEAVWRVELDVPMPAGLSFFEQREWLNKHAYIAECNLRYRHLSERTVGGTGRSYREWRADVPWSAIYLEQLEAAAQQSYSMQGLHFEMSIDGRTRSFLTHFTAISDAGRLLRIWGVAHDVTELIDLNHRLRLKKERLQSYATQLTGAEDRARRAIAVDLHDGIGQQLAGLGMTLEAAQARAPADVGALLGEATQMVRDVQSATQKVIADLSPPGLYDLGLEAALKWLAANLRGKDGLQVDMQVSVDDCKFDLDQRILAFKIIRELLRNVIKHAKVKQARVIVSQNARELRIEVSDEGVGFEWQMESFESRDHGFGLWSVVDRVQDVKGEIKVDTAPGKGCKVRVMLPLSPSAAGVTRIH